MRWTNTSTRPAPPPPRATPSSRQGQVDVDEAMLEPIELAPGEASPHHVRLIHGSPPNPSPSPRAVLAVPYIAADVRPLFPPDFAPLARGQDRHGHFELEAPPAHAREPAAEARWREAVSRRAEILFRAERQEGVAGGGVQQGGRFA